MITGVLLSWTIFNVGGLVWNKLCRRKLAIEVHDEFKGSSDQQQRDWKYQHENNNDNRLLFNISCILEGFILLEIFTSWIGCP